MKRFLIILTGILCSCLSSLAWSYDATMAKSYAAFFSDVKGAEAGKAMHFVNSETFIKDMQAGKEQLAIDIRTPAETSVVSLALPGSLAIPVDQIFEKSNLDRIPTDKPVIIVCKSGLRATAVATSLRHIGFNNVYILTGGFQGLSAYYGTRQAYPETTPQDK